MTDLALGKKLSDSGTEFANLTIASFKQSEGVHIPTLVAASARMSGTYLFRSFDLDLPEVQPGQAVLSKEADERFPMLLVIMANILSNLGITITKSTVPLNVLQTASRQNFLQTQRVMEPLFAPILIKYDLTNRQAAQAVAISTAMLIHHFANHLEPNAALGVATFAIIEGCKTAPDPVKPPGVISG
jgi:hypothetical protein